MRLEGLDRLAVVQEPPLPDVTFHDIDATAPPPTAAVDGSHAVLVDNGAYWVVAVRAGPGLPPTHLHATLVDQAADEVRAAYQDRGLPAPTIRSADAYAEAYRALAEMDATIEAIRDLPEGGLMLIDGALTQLPEVPQAIADRILDRATASGVHLAGVSKRSTITIDGAPLSALAAGPASCWWVPIPGHTAVAARLHAASKHVFRIDAETAVLPWLAHWSRDAVYRGYPYPLAKAHNAVAITHAEARRLAGHVRDTLGDKAHMLDDFHAVLDRNAPR